MAVVDVDAAVAVVDAAGVASVVVVAGVASVVVAGVASVAEVVVVSVVVVVAVVVVAAVAVGRLVAPTGLALRSSDLVVPLPPVRCRRSLSCREHDEISDGVCLSLFVSRARVHSANVSAHVFP